MHGAIGAPPGYVGTSGVKIFDPAVIGMRTPLGADPEVVFRRLDLQDFYIGVLLQIPVGVQQRRVADHFKFFGHHLSALRQTHHLFALSPENRN